MQAGSSSPRSLIVHPLPVAALVLLLLNDHWLKRAHPSWLTGKLSDFAGLVLAPILLSEVVLLFRRRKVSQTSQAPIEVPDTSRPPIEVPDTSYRRIIALITALVGVAFALIKLVPLCNHLYVRASNALLSPFGAHAASSMDPTDLIALAVLPGVFFWASRRAASSPGN